jgi:hypothetical protein
MLHKHHTFEAEVMIPSQVVNVHNADMVMVYSNLTAVMAVNIAAQ